jgi:hypothetical protein
MMSKYSKLAERLVRVGHEVARVLYDDDTTCDEAAAALRELEAENELRKEQAAADADFIRQYQAERDRLREALVKISEKLGTADDMEKVARAALEGKDAG